MEYALEVNHVKKLLVSKSRDRKVTKQFELQHFDFRIEPGYILGIIGRNGAGKTSLINTILGVYKPDEGEIRIGGSDRVLDGREAKKKIAFVTDECLFPLDISAKNIGDLFGPLYDGFDKTKYKSYLKRFEVPMKKNLRKLSRGMVVKVQLAFCLSHKASLYVFDEPSAGLDPIFRKELIELFFEIVAEGDKSIILSTHLTEDLDKIADYILYMDEGKQKLFMEKEALIDKYRLIRGSKGQVNYYKKYIVGSKDEEVYSEALIELPEGVPFDELFPVSVRIEKPTIEDIMVYEMKM